MATNEPASSSEPLDPVFVHARREMRWILGVYGACLLWSVGWSGALGYGSGVEATSMVWGIPTWVFVAIVIPWLAADVFTVWFCFFYMVDDALDDGVAERVSKVDEDHVRGDAGEGTST